VRQLFKDHVQIKKRKKKIRNLGFVFWSVGRFGRDLFLSSFF
jgi:hypothetical protein